MALDADVEAVREWATVEPLTFPVLIDRDMRVAELYGFVNVPASVWIDEEGRIVRPPDQALGDDRFRNFTGVDSSVHHNHLRAWVREGVRDIDDSRTLEHLQRPTDELQRARLHRRIAVELLDRDTIDGATQHLAAAEALAPNDWTIRRGNLPLVGEDPFGPKFFAFVTEWNEAGRPGYQLSTGKVDADSPL